MQKKAPPQPKLRGRECYLVIGLLIRWRWQRVLVGTAFARATLSVRPMSAALGTRRHQLVAGELAVAVFIERLQRSGRIRDFARINHAVVVRIESLDQRRERTMMFTAGPSAGSALLLVVALTALLSFVVTFAAGSTLTSGTTLSARTILPVGSAAFAHGRHQLIARKLAVVIFVESFERCARVADFTRVNRAVVICIESLDKRWWRTMVWFVLWRGVLLLLCEGGACDTDSDEGDELFRFHIEN